MAVQYVLIALRKVSPRHERRRRRCTAVDETKTKLIGHQLIVWAARDVYTKEILHSDAPPQEAAWILSSSLKRLFNAVRVAPIPREQGSLVP